MLYLVVEANQEGVCKQTAANVAGRSHLLLYEGHLSAFDDHRHAFMVGGEAVRKVDAGRQVHEKQDKDRLFERKRYEGEDE